jgi:hypothetical protein
MNRYGGQKNKLGMVGNHLHTCDKHRWPAVYVRTRGLRHNADESCIASRSCYNSHHNSHYSYN